MIAGYTPAMKRKKYRDADERILKLVQLFISNTPQTMWEFLRGIAHNTEMDS